ncbi:energy-coupling factor ABC transporter permease [Leptolinea tardivitalis]|nr:energy-coupling factor ABC transporter permease [Leptolinea tardivitalis]GAP20258.1 ABC-type Co2+ transport system, permease component [Leptolinea tardivitalis]
MLFSVVHPMHIPDGFLSVAVSIIMWIISIAMIAIALRKVKNELGDREVPLMGVLAAAIFAGQMLNFSVSGGTSGHLLGAAIATILLGPWTAVLVMTSVVSVQALLFQDGGVLALGANIFNMGVVGVFVSYAVFQLLQKAFGKQKWGLFVSGSLAAWTSIFIASLACALELAISGTSPANIAVPAMGAIHAIIGIGEALITLGALAFLYATRKDLFEKSSKKLNGNKGILIGGGIIAVVLAILSPLASSHPDGLEWVAEQKGFLEMARAAFYNIMPDYAFPGISDPNISTIVAGILGAVIVFGVAFGIARLEKHSATQE